MKPEGSSPARGVGDRRMPHPILQMGKMRPGGEPYLTLRNRVEVRRPPSLGLSLHEHLLSTTCVPRRTNRQRT